MIEFVSVQSPQSCAFESMGIVRVPVCPQSRSHLVFITPVAMQVAVVCTVVSIMLPCAVGSIGIVRVAVCLHIPVKNEQ